MPVKIWRLQPDDDRSNFRSGNIELDRFFARYAGQNQFRHHIGTTYVAIADDGAIAGFATVSASEIAVATLSKTRRKALPAYPLPVLRLARLAVDERCQGQGIGSELMRAVFTLARAMAGEAGCVGVVGDAKKEAVAYYEKLGFIPLEVEAGALGDRPAPLSMFLELGAIPKPIRG